MKPTSINVLMCSLSCRSNNLKHYFQFENLDSDRCIVINCHLAPDSVSSWRSFSISFRHIREQNGCFPFSICLFHFYTIFLRYIFFMLIKVRVPLKKISIFAKESTAEMFIPFSRHYFHFSIEISTRKRQRSCTFVDDERGRREIRGNGVYAIAEMNDSFCWTRLVFDVCYAAVASAGREYWARPLLPRFARYLGIYWKLNRESTWRESFIGSRAFNSSSRIEL